MTFRGSSDDWVVSGNTVEVTDHISTADDSEDETVQLSCGVRLGGDLEIAANGHWLAPFNQHSFEIDLAGPINLNGHTLTVFAGDASLIHVSGVISGTGDVIAKGTGDPDSSQIGKVVFDGPNGNTFHGSLTVTAGWANDGQWYTSTVHFNKQSGVVVNDRLRIEQMAIVTLDRPEQIGDLGTVEIDGHAGRRARDESDDSAGVTVGGTPQVSAGIDLNGHNETIGYLTMINFSSDVLPAFVLAGGGGVLTVQSARAVNLRSIVSTAGNDAAVPIIKGQLRLGGGPNGDPLGFIAFSVTNTAGYAGLIIQASVSGSDALGAGLGGNGALVLTGNNSFKGTWSAAESTTLDLRNAQALSGNTIELFDSSSLILRNVSISGSKLFAVGNNPVSEGSPFGSLLRAVGNCSWNGGIQLSTHLVVYADNLALNGPITGGGGIEFLNDPVIIEGSDPNTFTGKTLVHCALLEFNKPIRVNAFAGPLEVGGGGNPSEARWLNTYQHALGDIFVLANGLVNLHDHNEGFDRVVMDGGHIETGLGEVAFDQLSVSPSSTMAVI
jgi:hypothetical protein